MNKLYCNILYYDVLAETSLSAVIEDNIIILRFKIKKSITSNYI